MLGGRFFYSFLFFALLVFLQGNCQARAASSHGFAQTGGTRFVVNGRPLYLNGFNAYWLMYMGSDPSTRVKVTTTFQQASRYGMNVARTWAFSDGGNKPLQYTPGSYNEDMFKGLDFVISEARKYGVYLILSLVNNYENFGGRKQYVQWARDHGQALNNDDGFFTNPVVKGYYMNHIKDWVREMAAHVKSIDNIHLLEIGLEGFYGESMPEKKQFNPGYQVGTDFISNNQLPGVDFATIHLYPDQWMQGSSDQAQSAFVDRWVQAHIQDSNSVLRKPLLVTEFGKSTRSSGYTVAQRDTYFGNLYNAIYTSARGGGPCAGGLLWQLMAQGMDDFRDGYEVILAENPSTAGVIAQQSRKLESLK
ncbi:hypothetical protein HHK36_012120 [Tetracentron sinense]|uniref:mannan endo-1,4-beta-mannosidase n=1 Tax=Tetracentron sinense TaxID=13715 RepID=A0A834Z575_TETSI|nr:hypothetical protein HHK36_012120 [Tetracentron sinense]